MGEWLEKSCSWAGVNLLAPKIQVKVTGDCGHLDKFKEIDRYDHLYVSQLLNPLLPLWRRQKFLRFTMYLAQNLYGLHLIQLGVVQSYLVLMITVNP